MSMRRTVLACALTAVVAAACAAEDDPGPDDAANGAATVGAAEAGDPAAGEADASATGREPIRATSEGCEEGLFHFEQSGCEPATLIDLDEIVSGGPPPDGIPPIDDPVYESIEDASEWLQPTSPVMVVDIEGDARGFPLAILTWHEIVNDEVGGLPLTVTYCPLCNSALVFDRTVEGPDGVEVLDFGTSGRLFRSNLIMYDRQHRNLWTQFEGEAVVGERFLGTRLERLPAWLLGFEEFTELHPDAQVLSRETGHSRPYGTNPYTGYDAEGSDPFLFRGEIDGRFDAMTRLVGLAVGDDAVAITLDRLREDRVVEAEVAGRAHTVLWAPGQASALDTASIDDGRDVGQTAAFVAELDGEPVTLEPTDVDGRFLDTTSGSTFDLRGRAIDGPVRGRQLEAIPHDDTFWFVWVAFKPDTEVVAAAGA
jgi:hypothetical protein